MKIWGLSQISNEEKDNILSQHREVYNGYQTMQPKVSNTQPLYVQDFANDKGGIVVNNKGEVKPYTNMGINEQTESKEVCDECGAMQMSEDVCNECGGMMQEGECLECGWKGDKGLMEEKQTCSECGGMMQEGECLECGWKGEVGDMDEENVRIDQFMTKLKEEIGHLDDIYKVKDLNPKDKFDYVQGGGNEYGTFEKAHSDLYNEEDGEDDGYVNFVDNFEDPDNEDDGFQDINTTEISDEVKEQGYTGGGNAPDMDLSNIKPGYSFRTKGPEMGDGPFDEKAKDFDLDSDEEWEPYNFESGGPDEVFPTFEGEVKEYEKMESAWADDEEIKETGDVSGVQGIYGAMKPAYDFDSEGPGKAGPYQHSSWGGGSEHEDEDVHWEEDLEPNELNLDIEKFNPEDKSWSEIALHTGEDEFSHLDEDIKEEFIKQKNKINEMFHRFKMVK